MPKLLGLYHVPSPCLRESNALNLDISVLGQRLDSNAAPGGLVREVLLVLSVHLLKYPVSSRPQTHPLPRHWLSGNVNGASIPQSGTCQR